MFVISKTPLRISFSGGGTDLKEFFEKEHGCVINTAIDKYIYIAVHKYYNPNLIFLKYSNTEKVTDPNDIKHPLFREALKLTGVKGVEITSFADIPSTGSGLGSSSSFLVGLLNALYAYQGKMKSAKELAEQACMIERDILKEEGGYQDQYISAYGGFKHIQFNEDGSVLVNPMLISKEKREMLNRKLLMFFTGITRQSSEIHKEQKKNTQNNMEFLKKMKLLTQELKSEIEQGNVDAIGKTMHEGWLMKKELASGISNSTIDNYYDLALKAGAKGGKILGAGGGGFLLLYCDEEDHEKVRRVLRDLQEFSVKLEAEGSRIMYIHD